jgi:hypothetical protein
VFKRKGPLYFVVASAVAAVTLAFGQLAASAAPSVTVTPSSGLTDGQSVKVSGAGFAGAIGGITECNTTTGQPTVAVAGQQIPVGCSNPLNAIQTLAGGAFTSKPFTVHSGVVGPPGPGTDSAGKDAAADAAAYPCPPTAAQAAGGAVCAIAFGTSGTDTGQQTITFQASATLPTTGSTSATTGAPAAAPTTAATAATTPTTVATQVLGNQVSNPAGSPPPGQVASTGPGSLTMALAIAGLVALDLGYLTFSSTRASRGVLWRRRKGVVPET